MINKNKKIRKNRYILKVLLLIVITFSVFFVIYYKDDISKFIHNLIKANEEKIYTPDNIPEYFGKPFVYINNNIPTFKDTDYNTTSFEKYSELDSLGRSGVAFTISPFSFISK